MSTVELYVEGKGSVGYSNLRIPLFAYSFLKSVHFAVNRATSIENLHGVRKLVEKVCRCFGGGATSASRSLLVNQHPTPDLAPNILPRRIQDASSQSLTISPALATLFTLVLNSALQYRIHLSYCPSFIYCLLSLVADTPFEAHSFIQQLSETIPSFL